MIKFPIDRIQQTTDNKQRLFFSTLASETERLKNVSKRLGRILK
jgi:hypothetical protein